MTKRCLVAHTSLDATYPPYINISEHGEKGELVTVGVRGPAGTVTNHEGTFPTAGAYGEITMTRRDFLELLDTLTRKMDRT